MRFTYGRRRWVGPAAAIVTTLMLGPALVACGESRSSPVGPSLGARALQHLSPFEKKALKDKTVTLAELMASTQAYRECLTVNHIDVDDASDSDNVGPSGIQTVITVPAGTPNPDAIADKLSAKARVCLDGVSAIEDVWVLQHQASQADIDKAKDNFVTCVRSVGLALPVGASFADASDAAKQLLQTTGGRGDPRSAQGHEMVGVGDCLASIAQSAQVALPGLESALASLDTAGF